MDWVLEHRRLVIGLISMVCTLLAMTIHLVTEGFYAGDALVKVETFKPLRDLENLTRDIRVEYGTRAPRDERLMYLAIDDQTSRMTGATEEEIDNSEALGLMWEGWPFNRAVYGLVLDRLFEAGARLVVIDLMFPTPTANDASFKAALDRHRDKVVVGYNNVISFNRGARSFTIQTPAETLIDDFATDPRAGYVNFPLDEDNTIRSVQYTEFLEAQNLSLVSLSGAAANQLGQTGLIPPGYDSRQIRWVGPPHSEDPTSGFRPYPMWEIFAPDMWKANYQDGKLLEGKIIVIGPYGNFLKDVVNTPYGEMPGPEMHLNALNALLQQQFVYDSPWYLDLLLIAAGGILAWLLLLRLRNAILTGFVFLTVTVGYLVLAQFAYNAGVDIIVVMPLIAFNLFGAAGFLTEFIATKMAQRNMRATFERFVGDDFAAELLDNPQTFYGKLGGIRLPVTVLFSDIRGFTTMAESLEATELVEQLNAYLTRMTRIIKARQGVVDKFMGDAIMAEWGNIRTPGQQFDALCAVHAALDMRQALRELNQERHAAGNIPWAIGIGIHQGDAVAGSIGSPEKMEPTVIGDAVNLASRLEGQCKPFGLDIIFSEAVARHVHDEILVQSVAWVIVKGKSEPVGLFTALGRTGEPVHPATMNYLQSYEAGIEAFREGDMEGAALCFVEAEQHRGGTSLVAYYLDKCQELTRQAGSPQMGEGWNGVIVATEK